MIERFRFLILFLFVFSYVSASDDYGWLEVYNPVWKSQSRNSSESMPCGGGDIGMNVWVENDEIFLYLSRSGVFDENCIFPKLGRVRLSLSPNPFKDGKFRQELKLKEGYVEIESVQPGNKRTVISIWADVYSPVVEVSVSSDTETVLTATYETWRDKVLVWDDPKYIHASIGYRDAPMKAIVYPDIVSHHENGILWYHQNKEKTLFDLTVLQQSLESIKKDLWNPLKYLTFGGYIEGSDMIPDGTVSGRYVDTDFTGYKLKSSKEHKKHRLNIYFHTEQTPDRNKWIGHLFSLKDSFNSAVSEKRSREWWNAYWNRGRVVINAQEGSPEWQVGRNYQLFRYQLGCNAYGKTPTKFNGGLFTFDPSFVSSHLDVTPDHRNWGGGTHTAQNQRLVYWPMLKNGDFDMMAPQLDYYLNILPTAEARVKHYWDHEGACFTEQIELFGLPMGGGYNWNRPSSLDPGIQDNKWIDYEWETVLEFCKMAMDVYHYTGHDMKRYIPLVEKSLLFFDLHYQYMASKRSSSIFDDKGKLILYPGTGCETYKMAYNPSNTIAALKSVTQELLSMPDDYLSVRDRKYWEGFLNRIPDIPFRECNGHKTISPAITWQRIFNVEIPQLYPVFPWGLYGIGLPDLEVAINTWKYGVDTPQQKDYVSWHQDGIFCARLGLTEEAKDITLKKMTDSDMRFPTFWGPGHDWTPDHNWGGSGMIGVQEMLMQTVGEKIYLFPSWPRDWDVDFKLYAPGNTVIECVMKNGSIKKLNVSPKERKKDIIINLK